MKRDVFKILGRRKGVNNNGKIVLNIVYSGYKQDLKEMSSLNYKLAGVDIKAGNALVSRIKSFAKKTANKHVLSDLGGFGALFELSVQNYRKPILVSSTDGVGTKLKLAAAFNQHDSIGIDLVAMCVNDLITQGAKPLFFLDYYATSSLDIDVASRVIAGIAKGCLEANCALIGGETAEMPGMYQNKEYDLAGFSVGIVDKENLIDGRSVKAGDDIIALASSGVHANGFSLLRKILKVSKDDSHIKTLLTPTKIYVRAILELIKVVKIGAIAHITGGGLIENIPRVLPENLSAVINTDTWQMPSIFKWLMTSANIKLQEMYRVFNCGIGMVVIVDKSLTKKTIETLNHAGESAFLIGEIKATNHKNNIQLIGG